MSTTIVLTLAIGETAYTTRMAYSIAYSVKQSGSDLPTRHRHFTHYLEDSNASKIIFKKCEDPLDSISNFIDATIKKETFGFEKVDIQSNDILFLSSDGLYKSDRSHVVL